jgi:predicted transcriptional regulator
MVSKTCLLHIISDEMTSNLFKNIATTRLEGDIPITSLKLTRKQYYSRISLLARAGLVKREKGKYLLTAFGKVIYNALTNLDRKLENALNNYWKLKAIDAIQMLSREETNKVICSLIDDQEIRTVLLNEEPQLIEQQTTTNHILSNFYGAITSQAT